LIKQIKSLADSVKNEVDVVMTNSWRWGSFTMAIATRLILKISLGDIPDLLGASERGGKAPILTNEG